jgi:hypothetical protein
MIILSIKKQFLHFFFIQERFRVFLSEVSRKYSFRSFQLLFLNISGFPLEMNSINSKPIQEKSMNLGSSSWFHSEYLRNSKPIQEKSMNLGSSSWFHSEYLGNSKPIQKKSMNLGSSIWEVSRKWSFRSSTVLQLLFLNF